MRPGPVSTTLDTNHHHVWHHGCAPTLDKTSILGQIKAANDPFGRDLHDAIEHGKARVAAAKKEYDELKSINAQLLKKIKRWNDQAQHLEEHAKQQEKEREARAKAEAEAQVGPVSQGLKLPKIPSEPGLAPPETQPQKRASKMKLDRSITEPNLRPNSRPSLTQPDTRTGGRPGLEHTPRPVDLTKRKSRRQEENVDMQRWVIQEQHREQLKIASKANDAVQEEIDNKIGRLEKEQTNLRGLLEELRGYLVKATYSPQFLEISMRMRVAAQKVKEEKKTADVEKILKQTEKDMKRVRLASEGVFEDVESIKERLAAIEELQSEMGGVLDQNEIFVEMEKVLREREEKLELALAKEKEARELEVSQTPELLAYAEHWRSELLAAKQHCAEKQGVKEAQKRGFEALWHSAQDLKKHYQQMKIGVQQRLATEMAELQQRSAALLALLSVILPLTDQLRDLVESPVGSYIQNRVDMSNQINMPKLQRQLLELDSLRNKCKELNFPVSPRAMLSSPSKSPQAMSPSVTAS